MADSTAGGMDRRTAARRACLLGARYRTQSAWHPASLVDLSPRGCRLRIGEDLPRAATVRVQLSAAGDKAPAPIEMSGVVVWCRLEGLSYQAGIHFDDAPENLMDLLDQAG